MCNNNYFIEETLLGLELASQSYQSILQEESHTIDLIQIDKYESKYWAGGDICSNIKT